MDRCLKVSTQDVQNVFTALPSIQMIIPNYCQGYTGSQNTQWGNSGDMEILYNESREVSFPRTKVHHH